MNNIFRLTSGSVRAVTSLHRSNRRSGELVYVWARWCSRSVAELVKQQKVVVFLKGSPLQPMCGFSNAVVQILRLHGVDDYAAYDVLEDQDLRQGVKTFSNWPTIPQVFFNGEFVGGCDILLQMHQSGDLVEELQKLGIRSALLDTEKESK
ncbi:glutaredoxin-related protein 5, mitochondrial [Brachyhypopomus gauderio]|uniref:glutaredoxin-related protein 5, mitochondrial n=1 Tax=Brachyhypopomus gauderio TaxID=698409 RepID=UPI0040417EF5